MTVLGVTRAAPCSRSIDNCLWGALICRTRFLPFDIKGKSALTAGKLTHYVYVSTFCLNFRGASAGHRSTATTVCHGPPVAPTSTGQPESCASQRKIVSQDCQISELDRERGFTDPSAASATSANAVGAKPGTWGCEMWADRAC